MSRSFIKDLPPVFMEDLFKKTGSKCVRNLNRMYPLINIIHNLANQNEAPEPFIESIIEVRRNFEEVRTAFIKDEIE